MMPWMVSYMRKAGVSFIVVLVAAVTGILTVASGVDSVMSFIVVVSDQVSVTS